MVKPNETHVRSIVKTLTWRVTATCTTVLIVFGFTGKFVLSLGIGAVEVVVKMILYYFHERLWIRVSFGKKEN